MRARTASDEEVADRTSPSACCLEHRTPYTVTGFQLKTPAGAPEVGTWDSLVYSCCLRMILINAQVADALRQNPSAQLIPECCWKMPSAVSNLWGLKKTASPKVTPPSRGSQCPMTDQFDSVRAGPPRPNWR